MIRGDRIIAGVLAVVTVFGIAWLSQVPLGRDASTGGLLRLAWRARPERIEQCVTQSPEALAALPPHMRQTTICEGINASYQLEVRHDGEAVAEHLVKPGGLRGDRPLYVFLEIPVPVGDADIGIRFVRLEEASGDGDEDRNRDALREAVPPSLRWDERLSFAPGQVRLISYDPARRELFEVRQE